MICWNIDYSVLNNTHQNYSINYQHWSIGRGRSGPDSVCKGGGGSRVDRKLEGNKFDWLVFKHYFNYILLLKSILKAH